MPRENHTGAPPERYEKRDVNIRKVTQVGLGLIIIIGVGAVVAMWVLFKFFIAQTEPGPPPSPLYQEHQLPPAPRLQARPAADLKTLRASEEKRLNSYAWLDPSGGIVRIPIARAMELVAQRGLPYWPASPGSEGAKNAISPQSAIRNAQPKNSSGVKR